MLLRTIRELKKQRRPDKTMTSSSERSSSEVASSATEGTFLSTTPKDAIPLEVSTPPKGTKEEVPDQDAPVAAYLQGFNDITYDSIKHLVAPQVKIKDRMFLPSSYKKDESIEKYILRLKEKGLLPDHRDDAVEEKVVFVGQRCPEPGESSRQKAMETAKQVESDLLKKLHMVNVKISNDPGPIRDRGQI